VKGQKLITDFWLSRYGTSGHCELCGNTGIIDTTQSAITAAGYRVGKRNWCMCPNGLALREQTGEPTPPPVAEAGANADNEYEAMVLAVCGELETFAEYRNALEKLRAAFDERAPPTEAGHCVQCAGYGWFGGHVRCDRCNGSGLTHAERHKRIMAEFVARQFTPPTAAGASAGKIGNGRPGRYTLKDAERLWQMYWNTATEADGERRPTDVQIMRAALNAAFPPSPEDDATVRVPLTQLGTIRAILLSCGVYANGLDKVTIGGAPILDTISEAIGWLTPDEYAAAESGE
jgi:hypothetical protein